MTTIAKGNADQFSVYINSSVTFTPGSGGYIKFGCSSPDGVTRPIDRPIYAAETIAIPAGSTVFVEAVGADGAYVNATEAVSTPFSASAIAALQAVPGLGGGASAAPVDVTADAALAADDAGKTFVNNTGASKTLTLVTGLGQIVLVHGAQPLVAAAGAATLTGDTTTSVSKPRIVITEVSAGVYQGVGTVTGTPAPGQITGSRNASASDNDTTSVFTGAYTLTIPLDLAGYNGSTHQPPASGLATITGASGVTINGTLAGSVTRGLVSNRLFVITRIAENVFEVSGV